MKRRIAWILILALLSALMPTIAIADGAAATGYGTQVVRNDQLAAYLDGQGNLFIAGGATEVGWKEGKMLLMTQDLNNPCIWTWEGELKRHPEFEEPTCFKFQGQDRWNPKNLHPYKQGADILQDEQLRTGGSDTKWEVKQEGRYRITIDLFNETVKAELLK